MPQVGYLRTYPKTSPGLVLVRSAAHVAVAPGRDNHGKTPDPRVRPDSPAIVVAGAVTLVSRRALGAGLGGLKATLIAAVARAWDQYAGHSSSFRGRQLTSYAVSRVRLIGMQRGRKSRLSRGRDSKEPAIQAGSLRASVTRCYAHGHLSIRPDRMVAGSGAAIACLRRVLHKALRRIWKEGKSEAVNSPPPLLSASRPAHLVGWRSEGVADSLIAEGASSTQCV